MNRRIINEQFNISNMDFNNKAKRKANIFAKEIFDVNEIYKKILNIEKVYDAEISYLDSKLCAVVPDSKDLYTVVNFYSEYYPNASLNWLDVKNITYMYRLFANSDFTGDISMWDVSNVYNMSYMFMESKFNNDISKWDVSSVLYMDQMFKLSNFNGDISGWDVSKVESMNGIFEHSAFNGDISMWDVSNVSDMAYMFACSPFNGDIS